MIKKIAVALALLVAPALLAQNDREVLLTPGGTLYSIERELAADHPELGTAATSYLVVAERQGEKTVRRIIPGSQTPGNHQNAATAYDPESKTLFIFWQHEINAAESELVFTSLDQYGNWSRTTAFGSSKFRRENLRIAVTRKSEARVGDGSTTLVPDINVHAVWWENDGGNEGAGYAMLTLEKGRVTAVDVRDLASYTDSTNVYPADPESNPEILRHPALFETAGHEAVEVVFGSTKTNGFTRLRLKPVLDGRIRIPVGVKDHGFAGPVFRATTDGARIGALSGDNDAFVLYYRGKNALNYLMYRDGSWSALRTIPLDDRLTTDMAISAIRQMITESE